MFVRWELSSARQVLEGAEVAVGNQETLEALRRRDPLPDDIVHHGRIHFHPKTFSSTDTFIQ